MTIQEKVKISSEATKLTLFKEGMFYKCYNEDAMVFTQHVKAYKLSRKFVKSVGVELVSIGFPIAKEAVEVDAFYSSVETRSEKQGGCVWKPLSNYWFNCICRTCMPDATSAIHIIN